MKLNDPRLLAVGVCVAAAAWIGSGYIHPSDQGHPTPEIAIAKGLRAVQVRVSVAEQREDIAQVLGQTQAHRRVEIRSELDGKVTEVAVERGATVTSGAVLVRLGVRDRNAQLAEARALLAQYQAELAATQSLVNKGNRPELDVVAARARLETARAMISRIEVELEQTVVRAPFSGVIETRVVENGSYLHAGDPIATLVDLNPIRVVGYLAERAVGRITAGKTAQARLLDGTVVTGKIAYIATTADSATRTFQVELEVPNPQGRIVEGMTSELLIPLGKIVAHRISPAILSLADDGRLGVKIVTPAQNVEFLPVEIVASSPDAMWVAGLPSRVTLIVVGQDFVNPGQNVQPVEVSG